MTSVGSLGRAVDEKQGYEDEDWEGDANVEGLVARDVERLKHDLDRYEEELVEYTGSRDLHSDEGRGWKEKNERMQRLAVAHHAAKLQDWENVMKDLQILCMTVDCFLQITSGTSMMSKLLKPYRFVLGVVDEAHQVDLPTVYSVAMNVQTLLLLGDVVSSGFP